ncbi:MAG TPA: glycerol-3-phosphate dehydrogenase C-terminal domain-containing protein, partial [Anaerolineales bacterium]|nr:glycerol-3-phosphate dehydrogenase C-terminal domain-containing protein [Anaerolineales bacterium]
TLQPAQQLRLIARYGIESIPLFAADSSHASIPSTPYLWAELRQAARAEGVVHLDDLLLRRVRLGLLAQEGGIDLLPQIRTIVQPELGWDDVRWENEASSYSELWKRAYRLN